MSPTIKKLFRFLLAIIVIGVVGTASYYYLWPRPISETNTNPTDAGQTDKITKTEVESGKKPEKFPLDMPIETGAKISQNFNAGDSGRYQATQQFETNKTLAENYTIYQNYMKNNGWEIRSTVDQETYKMLFGIKGQEQLQVSIDSNEALEVKTVTISLTELTAKK